ncbi:hypothetical protein ABFA07_004496 [Porites harrisoni]
MFSKLLNKHQHTSDLHAALS